MSRILTSLHGRRLGLDDGNRLLVPNGLRLGDDGNQFDDNSPRTCALLDDFTGAAHNTFNWGVAKGSDGGAASFAILGGEPDGAIRATTGAGAGATMAVNGVEMTAGLNWQAQNGSLVFDARVRLSQITTIQFFAGFTNALATTLQAPVIGAGGGDTFTYNAANACGFIFDTTMTTTKIWCVGVKATVGATAINSGIAPVAATWIQLRIELDKNGNAKYFINGKVVGNVIQQNAVTKTTPLTPVIEAFTRAAGSATVDADYVYVGADRV
jgi:hypothetical protein